MTNEHTYYDEGYDAFSEKNEEDNPYNPETEEGAWKEWNEGWERGEMDETENMQAYCGGGYDWPRHDFECILKVTNFDFSTRISYEWVEESLYRAPDPYPQNIYIYIDEGNLNLELELDYLSNKDQEMVLAMCGQDNSGKTPVTFSFHELPYELEDFIKGKTVMMYRDRILEGVAEGEGKLLWKNEDEFDGKRRIECLVATYKGLYNDSLFQPIGGNVLSEKDMVVAILNSKEVYFQEWGLLEPDELLEYIYPCQPTIY
jgi:hypothetical protein